MNDIDKTKEQLIDELNHLRNIVKEKEGQVLDSSKANHQQKVAKLGCAIARELGLSEKTIDAISIAALLLDIGMIYIPHDIQDKQGNLDKGEYDILKMHTKIGYDLFKSADFQRPIAKIILQHHERNDGSGYPQGLKGDGILLEAKILGVADTLVAMIFKRPYREALTVDEALEVIAKSRGILFDGIIVDACLTIFKEGLFTF
ncbi:PAS/PAC sensor protein [Candidatus Magnetoovum chiemensis]|nr:PAS/PAC sensor protein [Candidatus Magnetoovum chiemensis]